MITIQAPKMPDNIYGKQISVTSSISRSIEDSEVNDEQPGGMSRPKGKFGIEKSAITHSVPRHSDSPRDPLNWPRWKKELSFASLFVLTLTIGTLKSLLAPVNAILATEFSVSYMAATALTGFPIIFGAVTALGGRILSKRIGKRALLLSGAFCMFIGSMWNMHVMDTYAQFLAARLFQGVGWGVVEGVIVESISDIYFAHERGLRINLYNLVSITFTWGTPIVGGYVSQTNMEWRNTCMIVSIVQSFSLILLIFGAPETTFNRSLDLDALAFPIEDDTPSTMKTTAVIISSTPSTNPWQTYLLSLRLTNPYSTCKLTAKEMLLPIKALGAPSTILTTLFTALLLATAFGIAQSLSMLFSTMPTFLFPEQLGYLFILPASLSILFYSVLATISHFSSKSRSRSSNFESRSISTIASEVNCTGALLIALSCILLGVSGLLAFGFYTAGRLSPVLVGDGPAANIGFTPGGQDVSLRIVSVLVGLLVAGAVMLNFAGDKVLALLSSSSQPPGNADECLSRELQAGHHVLQELMIGVFVVAMPVWIKGADGMWAGLRTTALALGVVVLVVGCTAGVVMWVKSETLRRIDSRVLGRGVESKERSESFFEA